MIDPAECESWTKEQRDQAAQCAETAREVLKRELAKHGLHGSAWLALAAGGVFVETALEHLEDQDALEQVVVGHIEALGRTFPFLRICLLRVYEIEKATLQ